jgi:hypothetical protein
MSGMKLLLFTIDTAAKESTKIAVNTSKRETP